MAARLVVTENPALSRRADRTKAIQSVLAVCTRDVKVGDEADRLRIHGSGKDTVGFESGCDFDGDFPSAAYVEDDDIRLHGCQVDLNARDVGHSFGEQAGSGVVFV